MRIVDYKILVGQSSGARLPHAPCVNISLDCLPAHASLEALLGSALHVCKRVPTSPCQGRQALALCPSNQGRWLHTPILPLRWLRAFLGPATDKELVSRWRHGQSGLAQLLLRVQLPPERSSTQPGSVTVDDSPASHGYLGSRVYTVLVTPRTSGDPGAWQNARGSQKQR